MELVIIGYGLFCFGVGMFVMTFRKDPMGEKVDYLGMKMMRELHELQAQIKGAFGVLDAVGALRHLELKRVIEEANKAANFDAARIKTRLTNEKKRDRKAWILTPGGLPYAKVKKAKKRK